MTYDQITAQIAIVDRQLDSVVFTLRAMRDFADGSSSIGRAIQSYEDMETRLSGKLQDLHLEREALEFERMVALDENLVLTLQLKLF